MNWSQKMLNKLTCTLAYWFVQEKVNLIVPYYFHQNQETHLSSNEDYLFEVLAVYILVSLMKIMKPTWIGNFQMCVFFHLKGPIHCHKVICKDITCWVFRSVLVNAPWMKCWAENRAVGGRVTYFATTMESRLRQPRTFTGSRAQVHFWGVWDSRQQPVSISSFCLSVLLIINNRDYFLTKKYFGHSGGDSWSHFVPTEEASVTFGVYM